VRARLHRFLLLFVMLALPLQALASAGMLACALAQPDAHHEMAMGDGDGCHDSEVPEHPAPSHDCKHCAACALGSVLPAPSAERVADSLPAAGPAAHPDAGYAGFIPDGPERPPRPFLA
jgi:hypothetical protein